MPERMTDLVPPYLINVSIAVPNPKHSGHGGSSQSHFVGAKTEIGEPALGASHPEISRISSRTARIEDVDISDSRSIFEVRGIGATFCFVPASVGRPARRSCRGSARFRTSVSSP